MTVHFDTSLISRIRVHEEHKATFGWVQRRSKVEAFWSWNRKREIKEGFYYYGDYDREMITAEELKERGYIVETDRVTPTVFEKPYVYVELKHADNVSMKFNNMQEAREWANKLMEISGKVYETVKY